MRLGARLIPDRWTLKTWDIKFAIIGSSIRKIVRVFAANLVLYYYYYYEHLLPNGEKRMKYSRQHIIMKFVHNNLK